MRKILSLCAAALFCLSSYSQENANRMIVHESSKNIKGFLTERIDSITFARVEGRVAADVKILDVALDVIKVEILRTPECQGFKLACLPLNRANLLANDAIIASYIDNSSQDVYYQDFTVGELTGMDLENNSEYALMTVGMDHYGIPCGISKAVFKTPQKPLVGNPKVATTIDDVKQREFTASFVPNGDVGGYAAVAGEKGTMLQQFKQFGAMMGFHNFGDMIKGWGTNQTERSSFTWHEMEPNTEYEIFVQAWDSEGTYADVDTLLLKTAMKGGAGVATVDVKLGEYKMTDWDGEMKPSQFISFTPSDQSSCYRIGVYLAAVYDENSNEIQNELRTDPPMPTTNWFQYEAMETDFQINPDTECVAIAAAKNGEGTWGECTVLRFTTPTEISGASPAKAIEPMKGKTIKQRSGHKSQWNIGTGKIPQFFNFQTGIKLLEK